jgi:hypothetical protein
VNLPNFILHLHDFIGNLLQVRHNGRQCLDLVLTGFKLA